MKTTLVVLCCILASYVVLGSGNDCTYTDASGRNYDFSPLRLLPNNSLYQEGYSEYSKMPFTYRVNICGVVNSPYTYPGKQPTSCTSNCAVCQGYNLERGICAGSATDMTFSSSDKGVVLRYGSGEGGSCGSDGGLGNPRFSSITLVCDDSYDTPLLTGKETSTCVYTFELRSKHACPISVTPPPPIPCKYTDSYGRKYDFSPLTLTPNSSNYQEGYSAWHLPFTYRLNICGTVNSPYTYPSRQPTSCTPDCAVCQGYNYEGGICGGSITDMTFSTANDGVVLRYGSGEGGSCGRNGGPGNPRISTITLICDHTYDTPSLKGRVLNTGCQYSFELRSKYACPINSTPQPTRTPTIAPTSTPTPKPVQCNGRGVLNNGVCSCFSGYYGVSCASSAPSQCNWLQPTPTSTVGSPAIQRVSLWYGSISLTVASPITRNRTTTEFFFGSCPVSPTSQIVSSCNDTFSFFVSISSLAQCNIPVNNFGGELAYSVPVKVINTEYLNSGGHYFERHITNTLFFTFWFPTEVSVGSNVTVTAPIDVKVGILDLNAPTFGNPYGTVKLFVTAPNPYLSVNTTTLSVPVGIEAVAVYAGYASCDESLCRQEFKYVFRVAQACSLTGNYNLSFALGCAGCQTVNSEVTLLLSSADICGVVSGDVELTSKLSSYDFTYKNQQYSYLLGNYGYFKVEVSSLQARVRDVTLAQIYVGQNILLSDNIATNNGSRLNLAVSNNIQYATFSFHFDPKYFSPSQYDIVAVVEVTYEGIGKKRVIAEVQATSTSTSSQVLLNSPNPTESPSATTDGAVGAAASVSSFGFFSVIIAVLLQFI